MIGLRYPPCTYCRLRICVSIFLDLLDQSLFPLYRCYDLGDPFFPVETLPQYPYAFEHPKVLIGRTSLNPGGTAPNSMELDRSFSCGADSYLMFNNPGLKPGAIHIEPFQGSRVISPVYRFKGHVHRPFRVRDGKAAKENQNATAY